MPEGRGLALRPASPGDAPALAALLDAIIAEGDKTAIPGPMTAETFAAWFLGPEALACTLAEEGGRVLGFQALDRHHLLPPGWADISSFAAAPARGRGVGAALWQATRAAAGTLGLRAVIRSTNSGAQAYYRAMGFRPPPADSPLARVPADRTVLLCPPG